MELNTADFISYLTAIFLSFRMSTAQVTFFSLFIRDIMNEFVSAAEEKPNKELKRQIISSWG